MQRLYIEPTKSTPRVEFDCANGVYKITGQAYPENALHFFTPLIQWLEEFLADIKDEARFEFGLQYMNTSSSKCIMDIIDMLDLAFGSGKNVSIYWYYDGDNESSLECAEEFSEDVELPFKIIQIEG